MGDLSEAYRKNKDITPEMFYDRFPQQCITNKVQKIANEDFRHILKSLYQGKGKYRYDTYRNLFVPKLSKPLIKEV